MPPTDPPGCMTATDIAAVLDRPAMTYMTAGERSAEHRLALWAVSNTPRSDVSWLITRDAATRLLALERYAGDTGRMLGTAGSA